VIDPEVDIVCYKQPTTLEERVDIAKEYIKTRNPKIPLYVDQMTNEGALLYHADPERLFIVRDGVVVYIGGPGPFGYAPEEVGDWLKKNLK